MQHPGGDIDGGVLVEREGVSAHEIAPQPFGHGKPGCFGHQDRVHIDPEQFDVSAEDTDRGERTNDIPDAAADINDAQAAGTG